MRRPSTPKRGHKSERGKAAWFSYYAGFSSSFASDILQSLDATRSVILDPWNGSGTTTQVAHERGHIAVGYDLNPAMVLVAKARLLTAEVHPSESSLCETIIATATPTALGERGYQFTVESSEPLATWFHPSAAAYIRQLELATRIVLGGSETRTLYSGTQFAQSASALAAFFYVALFRTVRELLTSFRSSNPTWLRTPAEDCERIDPSPRFIAALLRKHVATMAADQFQYPEQEAKHELAPATIELANSTKLPDPAGSVDVVLCSPPYGTRIDYAMATRPELAVLGFHTEAIDQLRRQMLGTSTVEATINEARSEWGAPCTRYLAAVRSHPSKASASYYWKNQLQYFDGLYRSLQELRRVLRTAGHCFIVVQDSYYKELHLDLANIVKGMTRPFEWQLLNRFNYTSRRHMGRVHVGARKYQRPSTATESVLHFVSRV